MLLPEVRSEADVDALRRGGHSTCRAALQAVAAAEGLAGDCVLFAEGSAIVGAVGDTVVKLFAPFDGDHCATERRVLALLDGRLPCPTPTLRGHGTFEGWPYLAMSRLRGASLSEAWDSLRPPDREGLCRRLGEVAAALHATPIGPVRDLPPSWPDFLARQRADCAARQARLGLDERWLRQIPEYLASVGLPRDPPVLLHTELMRAHVLVERSGDGWTLSGLLDFEPAMIGSAEYEFASVGPFVTCGDPALLRALLLGYGYREDAMDEPLQRRFLAYALLHRYSRLSWYLELVPAKGARTLEELARRWWAV